MATIGQLAGSPLADLTYFNNRSVGGIGEDEVNSQRGQDMLTALRKYDPNAQFVAQQMGGEGGSGASGYTLNFDPRLLPGADGSGQLGQGAAGVGTGNTFMPRFSTVQEHMQLANPNAVANSPVYGKVTDNTNIEQPASLLDTLGPLAVSAFGMLAPMAFGAAGLGMGANAASAIGAANGGLAAAPGGVAGLTGTPGALVSQLAKGIPNFGRAITSHTFNPISLIPLAGAGLGLPSWVGSGAATLGNLAQGGRVTVNPISAGLQALQLFGGGKGG